MTDATSSQDQAQTDRAGPAATLREGALKAVIWKNEGEHGPFYAATFTRTWKDEAGVYRDSHSFSERDQPMLGKLVRSTASRIEEMRRLEACDRPKPAPEREGFEASRTAPQAVQGQPRSR